jgi:hypothetical protein
VPVSPADIASLIVATFDLKEVQLVRDAIRTADISSGKGQPVSKIGPAPNNFDQRFHFHPEPKIEPRRHIHPDPVIEPRRHIRPVDRFEPSNALGGKAPDVIVIPVPVPCPKHHGHTIQPPWKVLPWQQEPAPHVAPKIKVVVKPPDIALKGTLLDCFI